MRIAGELMRDKKRLARKTYHQEAWIGLDGFAARKCRIIDASDYGARLLLDDADLIVDRFKLKLTRTAEGRTCKVAWQKGRELGAEFVKDD
jgi:hypothetical protein